ncbi:Coenzyme Q-binding protein COQ10, mitochondrial [Candida viswanathii]|uniref:Coenzyme Q-binding protein COQ10, mitochondrial n=1 Tax=Candida viswanathii TaxID=5486 RepID=A0A367YH43_9ASCO|nr:Coenzyme Q-binding protein COQ10, mitochondrial [Candida viswanathii]
MFIRIRPPPPRHLIPRLSSRTFFGSSKPQTYELSKILHGSPEQLYDIVSQVDKYHTFVPFVEESFISSRDPTSHAPTKAGLVVGWKDIVERFECDLTCVLNELVRAKSIQLDLFENLETEWRFNEFSKGKCKVEFTLLYKFKNPLYDKVSFMFAPQVTQIMIGAFEKQLKKIKLDEAMKKRREAKL